jgi:hypothetical protein
MIKRIDCFTVICDNCGKDAFEQDEIMGLDDKRFAEAYAVEGDFKVKGSKHYCPDCYEYDDDDNLIIKTIPNE